MPRKKAKIEEPIVPEETKVEEPSVESAPASEPENANPNVKIKELNGKRYLEIFDPLEGTTRLELIAD